MIFGQTPAATVPPSPPPPVAWTERVRGYASTAEQYVDSPIDDIASLIQVDAIWLGGFLLGLKFLTSGLFLMRKAHCPVPRQR